MEAFVITLREGVEAALIIVLILTYLKQTGRQNLRRWVYAGLAIAVIVSLLGAYGFSRIGFDPEDEFVEGILYGLAAVLVVSLVVWMWRASRGVKQQVENRLDDITAQESRWQGWGLLAFVFLMVFREGIETVLFLAALSLTTTSGLTSFVGGLVGLALATAFGVLFMKGSLRINFRYFFAVTGFVLLILAIRLAAGSLHEFHEAGVLALPELVEEGIEFLTADGTSTVILIALIALPMLSMIPERWLRPIAGRVSQS
jgi:FTR1 family protein